MSDVEISKPECYVCKRKGPINDFVFLEEYNGHIIERKYQIPLSECVGVRQLMAFSQQFELQTEFPPSDDLLQSQFDLRVSSSSNREKLIGLYMQRGYCVSSGSTSAVRFHMVRLCNVFDSARSFCVVLLGHSASLKQLQTCEQISEGKFRPPHLAKKNRLIHRTQKIEQPDRIADLSHRACNGCLKLVMGDTGESCTWNVSGGQRNCCIFPRRRMSLFSDCQKSLR